MATIAIAIGLTHQRFRPIVFAFHKAIGQAHGQKLEKGQNFLLLFWCQILLYFEEEMLLAL